MNKKDLIYIIIILLLLGGVYFGNQYYQNELLKRDLVYKEEVLKNDSLTKVNETQYTKLIDDTKTIRELEDKVDSLGFELVKKPKVVYRTKIVYEEVEKPIDDVEVNGNTLIINDFYPNMENPFIEYATKYNFESGEGESRWKLNPTDISIILSQRDDGIWKSDIKVPEYMTIGEVEIEATPLDIPKIDNFGWLVGLGYGKDLNTTENYIRVSGGLRYKKVYLDLGISSQETIDIGGKIEF